MGVKIKHKGVSEEKPPKESGLNRKDLLRDEYFEKKLSGVEVNMRDLADKYGLQHQSVRNYASREKWSEQIEKIRSEREDLLTTKLTERTNMALDKLNEEFATNEVAIRKRHALIARGLQVRAVTRLKQFKMEEFSPRDALFMLKLGLDEERRALGLAEEFTPPPESNAHPEYRPVAEQIGGHKKVQAIGMLLLKALRDQTQDIEDVGLGET